MLNTPRAQGKLQPTRRVVHPTRRVHAHLHPTRRAVHPTRRVPHHLQATRRVHLKDSPSPFGSTTCRGLSTHAGTPNRRSTLPKPTPHTLLAESPWPTRRVGHLFLDSDPARTRRVPPWTRRVPPKFWVSFTFLAVKILGATEIDMIEFLLHIDEDVEWVGDLGGSNVKEIGTREIDDIKVVNNEGNGKQ
uniref:Uncharacterized protein n=1 Tax=Lactuca sativa TaxID=4236 RepID=A0A9R1VUR4_LACSA|nr:hypothetical protein LSAT_V11C400223330 [Lactuca sativa]